MVRLVRKAFLWVVANPKDLAPTPLVVA